MLNDSVQIIYYHRLHFPASSGQTIQVIRDYMGFALSGQNVHLYYRSRKALSKGEIESLLLEYQSELSDNLSFHHVGEGGMAKWKWREEIQRQIISSKQTLLVTRTIDHAAYALKLASKLKQVRVVIELHETAIPHLIYKQDQRPLRAYWSKLHERKIFSNIHGIIATALPQKHLLDSLYNNHGPIVFLPNTPNPFQNETSANTTQQDPSRFFKVHYAGQFSRWKNTDILFQSMQFLPEDFSLEVAGGKRGLEDTTQEYINAKCQEFGVQGKVNYRGVLSPKQIPQFLSEGDCLVLPLGDTLESKFFTSPMKLFEYAASGTPMVVTDQPSTNSLIENKKEALLVEPNKPEELAKAIQQLADDHKLAQSIAARAKNWVQQYSSSQRKKRYQEFISQLF